MSVRPIHFSQQEVALVHDWLFRLRGGERCLQAFLCLYPQADVFSLFHKNGASSDIIDQHFKTASILNRLPSVEKYYRALLPLFPIVSKISLLEKYPVRISLSHAVSKNIRGSSLGASHFCYCFTPMRYIWDQAKRYLGWKSALVFPLIYLLRIWDRRSAKSITEFVAISTFVAARIRKYYGRRSTVIFPPVATDWLGGKEICPAQIQGHQARAYLFAGALVPYKGAELAIQACSELGHELWVAGDGPQFAMLKQNAHSCVKFLGQVSDPEMAYLLKNCKALIFPCKEDFGILPLEVQAAGRPVIALYAGACKETIRGFRHWLSASGNLKLASKSYTGVFIKKVPPARQLVQVKLAVSFYEKHQTEFSPEACRAQARLFNPEQFYDAWRDFALSRPALAKLKLVAKQEFLERFESLR